MPTSLPQYDLNTVDGQPVERQFLSDRDAYQYNYDYNDPYYSLFQSLEPLVLLKPIEIVENKLSGKIEKRFLKDLPAIHSLILDILEPAPASLTHSI